MKDPIRPWTVAAPLAMALALALWLGLAPNGGAGDGDADDGDDSDPDGDAQGPLPANAGSPLGTNLTRVSDFSREWAFVDAFRASRRWISGSDDAWDDGRAIDTDDDGWLRSLLPGQIARTLLFWEMEGHYPAGRYVVQYDGTGAIQYRDGARRDDGASAPGRDVLDVTPAQGGIGMNVTAVDPADPIRNIRVIMPGGVCSSDPARPCGDASPCDGGGSCEPFQDNHATQVFHPTFLGRIETYRVLRFMSWMSTNSSTRPRWEDRPRVTDARWSTHGVPVEVMVDLANRLHAEPWFTVHHLADDEYVRRFATYVRDNLDAGLRVWVEHSNEVWNGIFPQATYARERGLALGLSDDGSRAQLRYHSRRSVEIFAIFEEVLGGTDRLVRVMASQAASPTVSREVLDFEGAAASTDALAIAPYFGGYLGRPEEAHRVRGMSLDELFAELSAEALPRSLRWVADQRAIAARRGVPLVAYEAGQHLAGHGGTERDEAINALFDAANRDARMGGLYTAYLEGWRDGGGQLLVHFVNCSGYSLWGRWGALEYLEQPRSEAPKHHALQAFIESNDPWW